MAKKVEKKKIQRRRVVIKLEAPRAEDVFLLGDFNDWKSGNRPMKKDKEGHWQRILMIPPGRYEYKFLVDGGWRNDPRNRDFCQNCFGTTNNVMTIC
jgi:1,4-alpha-glucan branching enzyme